jgi:hypothetical protein
MTHRMPTAQSVSNGIPEPTGDTFALDQQIFEQRKDISGGLGPVYKATSCVDCHQNPVSGGPSQITEIRVGHKDANGNFLNPTVLINDGQNTISGRSIINDRARIRGEAVQVPLFEAPGQTRVGRFGWKDQHGSLLSFISDAYLNEMGITSRLRPHDTTTVCKTTTDPEDQPDSLGLADIDHFAQFVRGTKVPSRDTALAATPMPRRVSTSSRQFTATSATLNPSLQFPLELWSMAEPLPSPRLWETKSFTRSAISCCMTWGPAMVLSRVARRIPRTNCARARSGDCVRSFATCTTSSL